MSIQDTLKRMGACKEALVWAEGKTWPEIYNQCDRGDWLNWLYCRAPGRNTRKLALVKGLQVKQIFHLLTPKGKAAVEAAISFGRGEISRVELDAAADAASYDADADADAADAAYAAAAAYAAYAAAAYAAAEAAAYDAYTAAYDAAYEADAAADAARKASLKISADIFREHIKIQDFGF